MKPLITSEPHKKIEERIEYLQTKSHCLRKRQGRPLSIKDSVVFAEYGSKQRQSICMVMRDASRSQVSGDSAGQSCKLTYIYVAPLWRWSKSCTIWSDSWEEHWRIWGKCHYCIIWRFAKALHWLEDHFPAIFSISDGFCLPPVCWWVIKRDHLMLFLKITLR